MKVFDFSIEKYKSINKIKISLVRMLSLIVFILLFLDIIFGVYQFMYSLDMTLPKVMLFLLLFIYFLIYMYAAYVMEVFSSRVSFYFLDKANRLFFVKVVPSNYKKYPNNVSVINRILFLLFWNDKFLVSSFSKEFERLKNDIRNDNLDKKLEKKVDLDSIRLADSIDVIAIPIVNVISFSDMGNYIYISIRYKRGLSMRIYKYYDNFDEIVSYLEGTMIGYKD